MRTRNLLACSVALATALVLALTFSQRLSGNAGSCWAKAKPQDPSGSQPSFPSKTEREKSMTKEMTEEELVQLLKEGREKGYYIRGNLPDDPAELKQVTREMLKNMVYRSMQKMRWELGQVDKNWFSGAIPQVHGMRVPIVLWEYIWEGTSGPRFFDKC